MEVSKEATLLAPESTCCGLLPRCYEDTNDQQPCGRYTQNLPLRFLHCSSTSNRQTHPATRTVVGIRTRSAGGGALHTLARALRTALLPGFERAFAGNAKRKILPVPGVRRHPDSGIGLVRIVHHFEAWRASGLMDLQRLRQYDDEVLQGINRLGIKIGAATIRKLVGHLEVREPRPQRKNERVTILLAFGDWSRLPRVAISLVAVAESPM